MEAQAVHIPDNEQYRELKKFIDANRSVPGPLIQVLHRAQKIFGYLPLEVQHIIAGHAGEGDKMDRNTEATIVNHADFVNFHSIQRAQQHKVPAARMG